VIFLSFTGTATAQKPFFQQYNEEKETEEFDMDDLD
jgi:hypothetical protein